MKFLRLVTKQILGLFIIAAIHVLIMKVDPHISNWWFIITEGLFFIYCMLDYHIKINE